MKDKELVSHPLAVVDLTIAQQSKMRILVQPHWLHPIQAVHNLQAMETNYTVLRAKTHSTTNCLLNISSYHLKHYHMNNKCTPSCSTKSFQFHGSLQLYIHTLFIQCYYWSWHYDIVSHSGSNIFEENNSSIFSAEMNQVWEAVGHTER